MPEYTVYIYTLLDPREPDAVRYVGATTNPSKRLNNHIRNANRAKYHNANWLRTLIDAGVQPEMTLIECTTPESYPAREKYWIAFHREAGAA